MDIILKPPLNWIYITQPFGVNFLNFYEQWGLKGHPGIDFRAKHGCPIYAAHDGICVNSSENATAGNKVILSYAEGDDGFSTMYLHNFRNLVKVNDIVNEGQKIAEADNTGIYTTGDHLHFEFWKLLKKHKINVNNGFNGSENPDSYLRKYDSDYDKLPVTKRYGLKRNLGIEIALRFKNPWIHRRLKQIYKRNPLSLSGDEVNAIIYGAWDFDIVMNPAMWELWAFITKYQYKQGIRPFI